MSVKLPIIASILILSACSTYQPRPMGSPVDETLPPGSRPSSSLDITQGEDITTIELLKEKAQEIVTLKKRIRELEDALQETDGLASSERQRAAEQATRSQRLQSLLAELTTDQRKLSDRVISLEIEKLQLEKQVLNMKIAALAAESN